MNVIIIEDEFVARENLKIILGKLDSSINIIAEQDSIKGAIELLSSDIKADLIFLDIELADGNSFQIFEQVKINTPIIFTTAYTDFSIKAFELNSIDYLLKPIIEEDVKKSIDKFKKIKYQHKEMDIHVIQQLLSGLTTDNKYSHSFLVNQGEYLIPVKAMELALVFIKDGLVKAITKNNKTYFINDKMDSIESQLNTKTFFRANRQYIINREAIDKISHYFNGKLIIHTSLNHKEKIIISKAKATSFKDWLSST